MFTPFILFQVRRARSLLRRELRGDAPPLDSFDFVSGLCCDTIRLLCGQPTIAIQDWGGFSNYVIMRYKPRTEMRAGHLVERCDHRFGGWPKIDVKSIALADFSLPSSFSLLASSARRPASRDDVPC